MLYYQQLIWVGYGSLTQNLTGAEKVDYGCEVVEIPRLEENGSAVSASRVRKLLKERNFEEIKKIVPNTVLRFLQKNHCCL